MLLLAVVNALAATVFGALYVAAGTRAIGQPAFVAGVIVFFVGLTALWSQVERSRPGRRDALSRGVRIALAFALAAAAFPALVLMPLFGLRSELPPEAGLDHLLPGAMVAALAALTLTAGVNLAGIAYALAVASAGRMRRRRRD
jgi:hypothetical protein